MNSGNHGDEEDEMVGTIDLDEVDWTAGDIEGIEHEDVGIASASMGLGLGLAPPLEVKSMRNQPRSNPGVDIAATALRNNGESSLPAPPPAVETVSSRSSSPIGSVPTTRASRAQRTSPFNLKACSACKKGKATPIKCRVDRRHWEDHDWTDPPTRPWIMPQGFVEWLAGEERQAQQQGGDAKFVLSGVAEAAAVKFASDAAASSAAALAAANKTRKPSSGGSGVGSNVHTGAAALTAAHIAGQSGASVPKTKTPTWVRTPLAKQGPTLKQGAGGKHGLPTRPGAAALGAGSKTAKNSQEAVKSAGPRAPRVESASALLERMLGSALPPAPAPAPPPRPVIPASTSSLGGPTPGGMGLKRPRCLAIGCTTPVPSHVAFCSDDCVVTGQKQAAQALMVYHRKSQRIKRNPSSYAAGPNSARTNNGSASAPPLTSTVGGSSSVGGEVVLTGVGGGAEVKGESGGIPGGFEGKNDGVGRRTAVQGATGAGGAAATAAVDQKPFRSGTSMTPHDEEEFTKQLEAVRDRVVLTPAQKFRLKIRDRFRELFAEGMTELGVDPSDMMMASVLAWDLEHELHVFSGADRSVYKEKAQSLRFNIAFGKNPELFKVRR